MENVSFVIPMSGLALWSRFAMNATSAASRAVAQFVVVKEFLMLTIAKNVLKWRRTGMGAQRLSI